MSTKTATKIPTKKIVLWVGIISIIMLFAGLTSGYIVRQAEGNWVRFDLPKQFYFSTVVIIMSSVVLNLATGRIKKNDSKKASVYLFVTTILGCIFIIFQYLGWRSLVSQGIYFVGNPSGSFLYVLTGLHLAHLIAGIIALLTTTFNAFSRKYTASHYLGLELCGIYWHFLGALWVYLFFFLLLIR